MTPKSKIFKTIVNKYLLYIGQTFADVGVKYPSINTVGSLDFFLGRQLAAYQR